MLLALLFNVSLLVTLSAAYEYLLRLIPEQHDRWRRLGAGLLFGAVAMLCITFPAEVDEGIRLDGRTVVLTAAGYFLAPGSSALALTMAAVYRLALGGDGAVAGMMNAVIPVIMGLVFRSWRHPTQQPAGAGFFLLLGVCVHALILGSIHFLLPNLGRDIYGYFVAVLLGVMTPATVVICLLLQALERHRHLAQELAHSEALLRAITKASPDVLLVLDEDGRYLEVVSPDENLLYTTADQLLGHAIHDVMTQEDADKYLAFIRKAIAEGTPQRIEYSLETLDGPHVFEARAQSLNHVVNGKHTAVFVARDITERARAEEERRIAAIAFEAQQGMVIADTQAIILRVNQAFCQMLGYQPEELIGQPTRVLNSGHHEAEFYQSMWASMAEHGQWSGEIWDRHKDGRLIPLWMSLKAVKNPEGHITHYVAATTDISARKAMEEEIHALAFYDQLTALPNRRLFLDRLQRALVWVQRSGHPGALLFLDLDGFKLVNDQLGHHNGDELLVQFSQRLGAVVRKSDTVARLGGDEFVVLLELEAADALAARDHADHVARKILNLLSEPFDLDGQPARVGASIGAALITPEMTDTDIALGHADEAMYRAKARGKNQVCFFDFEPPTEPTPHRS